MYGVPKDISFDFLINTELVLVTFNGADVNLKFEPFVEIVVEHDWEVIDESGVRYRGDDVTVSLLHSLPKGKVIKLIVGDESLGLVFSNGKTIMLYDNPNYESFHIINKDQYIVI